MSWNAWKDIGEHAYLVECKRLIVVNDLDPDRSAGVEERALLHVQNIVERQADFHAVAIVVAPKDDLLQLFDPLICTCCTLGAELIFLVRSVYGKGERLGRCLRGRRFGRQSAGHINRAPREVEILGILVIRQDISSQTEPISMVIGVSQASLVEPAGLCGDILGLTSGNGVRKVEGKKPGLTDRFGRYA